MPHDLNHVCDECNYFDYLPADHPMNANYKKDLDRLDQIRSTLKNNMTITVNVNVGQGDDDESLKNMIRKENQQQAVKCSHCDHMLCSTHAVRAKKNGMKYFKKECLTCDACCWFDLS